MWAPMAFRLLVLHGPNMNLLGQADIDAQLESRAGRLGVELDIVQSHHEGGLLEALHDAAGEVDAVLVNPGALAPQAFSLAEALRLVGLPSAEVLLSSLPETRGASALTGAVKVQLHGKGAQGYLEALEQLAGGAGPARATSAEEEAGEEEDEAGRETTSRAGKSIGRRSAAPAAASAPGRGGKTIGRKPAVATEAAAVAGPVGKSIGRAPAEKRAAEPAVTGLLTRAKVKEQITLRLKGQLAPDVLAAWAREQWSALHRDAPCEAGAKETLDTVLLTLMAGAKAGDHVLLAQIAKLDR